MSSSSTLAQRSALIKSKALDLGFMSCGISKADFLADEAPRLERWLKQGMHGEMSYMANHFDKRLDPRVLVPGAKSIVSLLFNYYPKQQQEDGLPKVSKYAYGEDYHYVVKDRLKDLMAYIQVEIGEVGGRCFVDSAPVLDKAWAAKSGLGWVGKHSNLISKQVGSFFFIAELIIDLDLAVDGPVTDHCGTCTKCIDACPTDAIVEPYQVDGSKCISYFTIELKEALPAAFKGSYEDWLFGCDICQDVCPWNRFAQPTHEERFAPSEAVMKWSDKEWNEITEDVFKAAFRKSPLKRTGFAGIQRNLEQIRPTDRNNQE